MNQDIHILQPVSTGFFNSPDSPANMKVVRTKPDRIIKDDKAWLAYELSLPFGYIGMDEVGRGPLSGPVVAAACWLPKNLHIDGVQDSKTTTEKQRELLYNLIKTKSISWGIGAASHTEVDIYKINIACHLAMQRALYALTKRYLKSGQQIADIEKIPIVVDGNMVSNLNWFSLIKGDRHAHCISAASILAKVLRDRWMTRLDKRYPGYDWAHNKGYGSPKHLKGIETHGLTDLHRRTFTRKFQKPI